MKLLLFITLAMATAFVSCTQMAEEAAMLESVTNQGTESECKVRTPEEALQIACNILNKENIKGLSASADIKAYTGGRMSRSAGDESIYVVNFEEGGFALVPAVDNGIDVYGLSDKGKFVVNPDDENDLGSYILTLASGLNPGVPITPGLPIDSTDIVEQRTIVNHNGHECYYDSITTRKGNMGKYLLTTVWGDAAPYSAYTPMDDFWHIHCAVGCVPVAMGQIMAYHKHPKSHLNKESFTFYSYDWNSILSQPSYTEETSDALNTASFLYSIAEECGMDWGPWVSWTSGYSPVRILPKFGYSTVSSSNWMKYNYEKVKSQIDAQLPIYVRGNVEDPTEGGHAWVIDGYYHRQSVVKYTRVDTNEVCEEYVACDLPLVHCNWGWAGDDNGWFHSGIFPTRWGDLSYGVQMLINIKP